MHVPWVERKVSFHPCAVPAGVARARHRASRVVSRYQPFLHVTPRRVASSRVSSCVVAAPQAHEAQLQPLGALILVSLTKLLDRWEEGGEEAMGEGRGEDEDRGLR